MTLPRRLRADAGRAWSAARRRDLLVPGTVTVSVVAATAILTPGHWTDPGWAAVLLLGALLRWRHRRPIAVAVTSLAVCAVYYPLSPLDGPAIVVPVVALYAVAGSGRTRAAAGLAAVAVGAAWYGERLSTSH